MGSAGGGLVEGQPFPSGFALFLVQVVFIIALAKFISFLLKRLKQPAVVGEMLSGIVLGPTVLGRIPGFTSTVFPPESVKVIQVISNFGLCFFMFLVGLELDPARIRKDIKLATLVSAMGLLVPFVASMLLAIFFVDPMFSNTNLFTLGLFLTCALGMSALPVLARILAERRMLNTRLGGLSMTIAAVDDVAAWVLLAVVIAIVRAGNPLEILWTFLLTVGEMLIIFYVVKPLINLLVRRGQALSHLSADTFLFLCLILIVCAWFTEVIGLSALIGAFQVGLIIPRSSQLSEALSEKFEYFTVGILMPLYFCNSGLRTQFGLIDSWSSVGIAILVIVVATVSKVLGIAVPCCWMGIPKRTATVIGILMSCKGLIALIIVNFGYDYGIITPRFFAILVLMVLVTTMATVPLVQMVDSGEAGRREAAAFEAMLSKKSDAAAAGGGAAEGGGGGTAAGVGGGAGGGEGQAADGTTRALLSHEGGTPETGSDVDEDEDDADSEGEEEGGHGDHDHLHDEHGEEGGQHAEEEEEVDIDHLHLVSGSGDGGLRNRSGTDGGGGAVSSQSSFRGRSRASSSSMTAAAAAASVPASRSSRSNSYSGHDVLELGPATTPSTSNSTGATGHATGHGSSLSVSHLALGGLGTLPVLPESDETDATITAASAPLTAKLAADIAAQVRAEREAAGIHALHEGTEAEAEAEAGGGAAADDDGDGTAAEAAQASSAGEAARSRAESLRPRTGSAHRATDEGEAAAAAAAAASRGRLASSGSVGASSSGGGGGGGGGETAAESARPAAFIPASPPPPPPPPAARSRNVSEGATSDAATPATPATGTGLTGLVRKLSMRLSLSSTLSPLGPSGVAAAPRGMRVGSVEGAPEALELGPAAAATVVAGYESEQAGSGVSDTEDAVATGGAAGGGGGGGGGGRRSRPRSGTKSVRNTGKSTRALRTPIKDTDLLVAVTESSTANGLVSVANLFSPFADASHGLKAGSKMTLLWLQENMEMPSAYMNATLGIDDIRDNTLSNALARARGRDAPGGIGLSCFPTSKPFDDTLEEAGRKQCDWLILSDTMLMSSSAPLGLSFLSFAPREDSGTLLRKALRASHCLPCGVAILFDYGTPFALRKVICPYVQGSSMAEPAFRFLSLTSPADSEVGLLRVVPSRLAAAGGAAAAADVLASPPPARPARGVSESSTSPAPHAPITLSVPEGGDGVASPLASPTAAMSPHSRALLHRTMSAPVVDASHAAAVRGSHLGGQSAGGHGGHGGVVHPPHPAHPRAAARRGSGSSVASAESEESGYVSADSHAISRSSSLVSRGHHSVIEGGVSSGPGSTPGVKPPGRFARVASAQPYHSSSVMQPSPGDAVEAATSLVPAPTAVEAGEGGAQTLDSTAQPMPMAAASSAPETAGPGGRRTGSRARLPDRGELTGTDGVILQRSNVRHMRSITDSLAGAVEKLLGFNPNAANLIVLGANPDIAMAPQSYSSGSGTPSDAVSLQIGSGGGGAGSAVSGAAVAASASSEGGAGAGAGAGAGEASGTGHRAGQPLPDAVVEDMARKLTDVLAVAMHMRVSVLVCMDNKSRTVAATAAATAQAAPSAAAAVALSVDADAQ